MNKFKFSLFEIGFFALTSPASAYDAVVFQLKDRVEKVVVPFSRLGKIKTDLKELGTGYDNLIFRGIIHEEESNMDFSNFAERTYIINNSDIEKKHEPWNF